MNGNSQTSPSRVKSSQPGRNLTLIIGAVAYDPKVVTIWNGFREYFLEHGLAFDYVLYSNYERQVEALFAGHIHVAWNSPLAWIQSQRLAATLGRNAEAICMRDSDCDLKSVVIVRTENGIQKLEDLVGKRVAVGAKDSPQATLIPLGFLARAGLTPGKDFEVLPFEKLAGLHGDHIGGERDAVRALINGEADAACIIESNLALFVDDGTLPQNSTRILAKTPNYDHCNFTILDNAPADQVNQFRRLLLEMKYDNPGVRPLLDLEGLKAWKPGRTEGYAELEAAVDRFGTIEEFVRNAGERCRQE
jgi:ABC-type phosphate/phosphonate transport system substrate-binding protein